MSPRPTSGRRRPSETFGAWSPPSAPSASSAPPEAHDGWSRDDPVGADRAWAPADGSAPAGDGRGSPWRRAGAVVAVLAAVVAGARLGGVDLPAVTPSSPRITVEEATPGVLPGAPDAGPRDGLARWEVDGRREVVVDPRSGEVMPGGEDPTAGLAGSMSATPIGRWSSSTVAPVAARADATALWTGACPDDGVPPACGVVVLWGGGTASASGAEVARDGALYDPEADRWWPIPDAPIEATSPLPGVWAGDRLVVWGGVDPAGLTADADATRTATGAVYDPRRGNWEPLPAPPISGRTGHVLVWAGGEVVVWGGGRRGVDGAWLDLDDGAAYHPELGTWRVLPPSTLSARSGATAVALDHRVVVWGGRRGGDGPADGANLHDGAVLDVQLNTWTPLPEVRAQPVRDPGEPVEATLLGEGNRVLLAAPFVVAWRRPVYATYELGDRRWRMVSTPGEALWRGAAVRGEPDRVVVWGGRSPRRPRPDGAIGIVRGPAWPLPDHGRPSAQGQAVVWTGDTLVVWGGEARTDPRALVWSAGPPPGQEVAFPSGWP